MTFLIWTLITIALGLTLCYRRVSLLNSTVATAVVLIIYSLSSEAPFGWKFLLWIGLGGLVVLNLESQRRRLISGRILGLFRSMLPRVSATEQAALDAGGIWWEGGLFAGSPDWAMLNRMPAAQLTPEEQAYLDGPVEEFCRMLDDWQVTHELLDLPPEAWEFMRRRGLFSLLIPTEYGGMGFSPLASSIILTKIASRSATASSIVGVPNSLGPAELLLHYGTPEQKQQWLPALARGDEIPCFGLTSPRVGSDATALTDTGVVCKGTFKGKQVIGIRLNWDKRYITLAPIATVLGLAFRLRDPEHLIGDIDDYGITAALVPTDLPGIEIGRRHFPINIPFQNGPTSGKDVFIPVDNIIGGPAMAGKGWNMLVQQLAVGRCITLPSNSVGGALAAVYATGAYAQIRRQFGLPIGKFHGVAEVLARMAGLSYIMTAASRVTCAAINAGEQPAVPSAILKYHNTEMGRQVANDAMDVQGGKAIMMGPKNYLARGYESVPIGVTVEGANILTRNLIIFGQGAVRCHPFILQELEAARDEDAERGLRDFDRLLFRHIGHSMTNAAKSFVMALTASKFVDVPATGPTRRYYQHINRFSAAFALAADAAMLSLGGDLKRQEMLSARLGDVLSYLYLSSMVLKHYRNQGEPAEDLPIVEWACRTLLYRLQEQMHGLLRNLPNRLVTGMLRILIFPRGRSFSAPGDTNALQIADLIINPTATRERLADCIYKTSEPTNQLGLLQDGLVAAEAMKPIEKKVTDGRRSGTITAEDILGQIEQAEAAGLITPEEAGSLRKFDDLVMSLTAVDDFAPDELPRRAAAPGAQRKKQTRKAAPAKSKAKPAEA